MPTLRLTQYTTGPAEYRVVVRLEDPPEAPQEAIVQFPFSLTEADQEDLRWYLEDFLQHPLDPEPIRAARIEQRLADLGLDLFRAIFETDEARDLWAVLRRRLNQTRVEVAVEDVRQAAAVPWELLRDPRTDVPLALRAAAFVRSHAGPAQQPLLPRRSAAGERVRILLVICRPGGRTDVPFRSVAGRLIKGLSQEARQLFQLDVLRPPTFEQLSRVLRQAAAQDRPYHIVHFDGHGTYLDVPDPAGLTLSSLVFKGARAGAHGYLLFEDPDQANNIELVDGIRLGNLLVETNTPVLVLNACRSAHAETDAESPAGAEEPTPPKSKTPALRAGASVPNLKSEERPARAFGSLAQEVMDTGLAGVVAMRYNVYVVTAAQFMADLYAALGRGQALGEAVAAGRKQLHADPQRTIAYDPVPLQDWLVPVVYEAAPIEFFPRQAAAGGPLQIDLDPAQTAPRGTAHLPSPDTEFIGRDETLLALDRAFDRGAIVLLHAYAGSGKTATAAEFARWYRLTGGLAGPVLFTAFERPAPLPQVLDTLGRAFEGDLARSGINWLALPDAERRAVALQVMQALPLLWIWDNVEPVAGFPRSEDAGLSQPQQAELAAFLRAAREGRAKFLLTSRRDEHDWLGDLPRRIAIPPMPMQERVQLARALAEKYGRPFTSVEDWRPLLRFSQGNPLTIISLVGQALRGGLTSQKQIERFVRDLQWGEAQVRDEAAQGRAKSLAASLGYGFEHAFDEAEQAQLALLHLFQGFVDVDVLRWIGNSEADWGLPQLHGVTNDDLKALLNRAADVGLLTSAFGRGSGFYTIHPALPWFFRAMFEQYYPEAPTPGSSPQPFDFAQDRRGEAGSGEEQDSHSRQEGHDSNQDSPLPLAGEGPGERAKSPTTRTAATRAFVEAMGELGDYYAEQYVGGNRDVIALLEREEANLRHARRLARQHGWYRPIIGAMQGLDQLYDHTGRRAEWRRLVEEIRPDFVDPADDGPRPGREEEWSLVTLYRVHLAHESRAWAEAERLQRIQVDWLRQRAAPFLVGSPQGGEDISSPPQGGTEGGPGRNTIRSLAVSIEALGTILLEQNKADCIEKYKEAIDLCQLIDDKLEEAILAFNLGHAYLDLPGRRDLAQAERWYQRSLELRAEGDRQGRARYLGQLGLVAYGRFEEAREARQPAAVLLEHLNAALSYYQQALDLLPANAVADLAVTHNQLGEIYRSAGDVDRALPHYREATRYADGVGDHYRAGTRRFNVALALLQAGRLADARDYAEAALRNFEEFGPAAAAEAERARGLLAHIDQLARGAKAGGGALS